jgi:hypothetical protein
MSVPSVEVQSIFDKIAEDGVLGGYILIGEVLHEDHLELVVHVSKGVTPWSAMGMLSEAMGIVPVEEIDVSFEDEESQWDDYFGGDEELY